jgi:hypothetical protein
MDWLRLHHDTSGDGKFRTIARRAKLPMHMIRAVWEEMLINASKADPRGSLSGWDHEDVAAILDMEPGEVEAVFEAMQGKTLEGMRLSGWDRRQVKREREDTNAAGRAKEWREARKTPPNATERHPNATEHPEEIRGEEKKELGANAPLSPEPPTLDLSPPNPTAEQQAFDAYNAMAERAGLPKAQKFDAGRRGKIRQRLKDCGGLAGWMVALDKAEASSLCRGKRGTGWRADLDFLLTASKFAKLMEGSYDDHKPEPAQHQQRKFGPDLEQARLATAGAYAEFVGRG